MTDTADIHSAQKALDSAIETLEQGLGSLISRIQTLEATALDSESFRKDRTKLAKQLDDMAAEAESARAQLAARETEFIKIAQDSEAELDQVMQLVSGALERSKGG